MLKDFHDVSLLGYKENLEHAFQNMDELHLTKLDALQQNLEPKEKGKIIRFTQKMRVEQLGKQKTGDHQVKIGNHHSKITNLLIVQTL